MSRPTAIDVLEYLEGYGITKEIISIIWIEKRIDNLIMPWVERHTRIVFDEEKEITEYLSGNGKEILVLSKKPVNEIVSLAYISSADIIPNLSESVELNNEDGIIIKKAIVTEGNTTDLFIKGNKNIKVTYKYGYDNFIDTVNNKILEDVKEAIVYMAVKQVLIQIGARTGGGSISSQAWSRNFGSRGKYTDIINNLDMMAYEILKPYMTGVVGT
jgi:hypothetical protein